MRKTVTVAPKWAKGKEFRLQCTVRGVFNNVLTISKRAVKVKGLNSCDMAGFYSDTKKYYKFI